MRARQRRHLGEVRWTEELFAWTLLLIPHRIHGGDDIRMPFGKYRGMRLCDIKTSYLHWLLTKATIWERLREDVQEEFDRRLNAPPPADHANSTA